MAVETLLLKARKKSTPFGSKPPENRSPSFFSLLRMLPALPRILDSLMRNFSVATNAINHNLQGVPAPGKRTNPISRIYQRVMHISCVYIYIYILYIRFCLQPYPPFYIHNFHVSLQHHQPKTTGGMFPSTLDKNQQGLQHARK